MGITNLLQFIKDAGTSVHVTELKGATVAVDAYSWLHKGIFGCADKLARGEDSDLYVKYCMKYVNMLQANKIKVVMVFDGRNLPAKEATEEERRKRREAHKMKAAELLILERRSEALSHLKQSIDVTHKMALGVMKASRGQGADCIVAPFEADAQLAYLNIAGYVDYVITEDSDLLVFGTKKVLYKLNLLGVCTLIDRIKLPAALNVKESQYSDAKFRHMCILAGSDYWPGIKGMGLKRAKDYIFSLREPVIEKALRTMTWYVKGVDQVQPDMLEHFNKAELMFMYQPVFDPLKREVVFLTPITATYLEEHLLVKLKLKELELPAQQAFQLALGNLDPFTLEQVDEWKPDGRQVLPTSSIWSKEYEKPIPHNIQHEKAEKAMSTPSMGFQKLESPCTSGASSKAMSTPSMGFQKLESPGTSDISNSGCKMQTSALVEIPSPPNTLAFPSCSRKRKIEETDILKQYSEPTPPVKYSPEPTHSGYFSEPKGDEDVKKIPRRSLNPFIKYGSNSPDLSDRRLKSGLDKIVNEKGTVKRVLSPWFTPKENESSPEETL